MLLAGAAARGDAAPAPCNGVAQISDPSGDGHHTSTDVTAAWLTEASGHLQAVVQIRNATWVPEHDDAQVNGSGFAVVFTTAGQTRYVRARAAPGGALSYDYGSYSRSGGFASEGPTTGSVEYGVGGAATLDVPAATGASGGATLARPFVLTYDGINEDGPDWVDHAPGGAAPDDPAVGADYVMGSCAPGTATTPVGSPAPGAPGAAPGPPPVTAVQLSATKTLTGGGRAVIAGKVLPARGGVAVTVTRRATRTATTALTTAPDGSFRTTVPVGETTRVRATAAAIGSQTLTVLVRSTARIATRRLPGGRTRVRVTVRPALPGRVLLLPASSPAATATRSLPAGLGRFSFRLPRSTPHGRYQVVFIPSGDRAERATSNTGVIR